MGNSAHHRLPKFPGQGRRHGAASTICSCGERSPLFAGETGNAERRAWHRQHQATMAKVRGPGAIARYLEGSR